MTAGEFKDLLNVADYSKAKGCAVEDITKHGIVESLETENFSLRLDTVVCRARAARFLRPGAIR